MTKRNASNWLILFLVFSSLTGCAAVVVGAAVTTVDIATDRRTVGSYIDDNNLEVSIRSKVMKDSELKKGTHVSVTAMNGIVLLTGEVFSNEQGNRIIKITRDHNPREVINHLQISGTTGIVSRGNDAWITSKVKTALYTRLKLDANRIKVVTEYSKVYLLGLVSKKEARDAVNATRTIKGVTKVYKVFEYI